MYLSMQQEKLTGLPLIRRYMASKVLALTWSVELGLGRKVQTITSRVIWVRVQNKGGVIGLARTKGGIFSKASSFTFLAE